MLTYFRVFVIALCCFSVYKGDALNIKDGSEPFFRRDYTYVAQQEAWYKVHRRRGIWFEAYQSCKLEGGELMYPGDQAEEVLLRGMVNEHSSNDQLIWVGAHALFVDGIYVDLHGKEISDYYAPWELPPPPEPMHLVDYCLSFYFKDDDDGIIDDKPCTRYFLPFVCKKQNLGSMVNTACQTIDTDYKPNGDGTKCYKIHKEPTYWSDAYATCQAEQSYLVIINDAEEAKFIAKSVKNIVDKMGVNSKKPVAALVGFHDKFVEGDYVTIHGESLDKVYNEWAEQNSTDTHYDDCGGIRLNDGLIMEISCFVNAPFVCEKEIDVEVQPTTESETQTETTSHEHNFIRTDNILL